MNASWLEKAPWKFLFPQNSRRFLQFVVVGHLLSAFCNVKLWLKGREFPVLPLFEALEQVPAPVHLFLFGLLILSSLLVVIRPGKVSFGILLGFSWLLLVTLDLTRLTPFGYLSALWVITLYWPHGSAHEEIKINILRALTAGLYFWAGFFKLNHGFVNDMIPWFLNHYVPTPAPAYLYALGIFVALGEMLSGLFLLFPRTRAPALAGLIAMHLFLAYFLSPLATNFQAPVAFWNIFQAAAVFALFGRTRVPARDILRPLCLPGFVARVLVMGLLPLANILGWGNDILSFRLYSASVLMANVKVDDKYLSSAPPLARKIAENNKILNLPLWSIADTGVFFATEYSYRRVFRELCETRPEGSHMQLILNRGMRHPPLFLRAAREDEIVACGE
jgi:uncharacterized membrane protein YphA (DoxX/SURF4 family)